MPLKKQPRTFSPGWASLLTVFCLILLSGVSLAEPQNKQISIELVGEAFEKAVKSLDIQKSKKQLIAVSQLKSRLETMKQDWIASREKERRDSLGTRVKQNWEKNMRYGSPVYYDYYLRNYEYSDPESMDITKTDSLVVPYVGYFKVKETLYVERIHSPGVTDRRMFFYTVNRLAKISFEYRDDKIIITNTEDEHISVDPGWPEIIIKRLQLI